MGNTNSSEEGRHRLGFHVLKVKDDSPAYKAGIRPFFDYIVAINGVRLNTEVGLQQMLEQMNANEEKAAIIDIYSTREQAGRRLELQRMGDGTGSLLGCSVRFCMFDAANDVVWHILDVAHGSPAETAGLCSHSDYVIGTPYGIMRGEGDLYDLVEDNIGEPLRLYIYNSDMDNVREVVIVPNEAWGGEGLLGCDVGYGFLHRLPRQGSNVPRELSGSPRRTPSLPFPPTQPASEVGPSYIRKTMPTAFYAARESPNIVAPIPQSSTWRNPGVALHGAILQNAMSPSKSEGDDERDFPPLTPLRFGRGERPDAEDEAESEDEFVSGGRRGNNSHGLGVSTH